MPNGATLEGTEFEFIVPGDAVVVDKTVSTAGVLVPDTTAAEDDPWLLVSVAGIKLSERTYSATTFLFGYWKFTFPVEALRN